MRFNKYLAMCFLASSLMCGTFTSCDDEDADGAKNVVNNEKTIIEQGRADGKTFGENYNVIIGDGEFTTKVTAGVALVSVGNKYKDSQDNVYKTAFAEAAVEVVTGKSESGDAAVKKFEDLLNSLSKYQNILGGGNASNSAE